MTQRFYGKLPVKTDKTTPTFRWLMDGALSSLSPQETGYDNPTMFWPMLANDRLSCCAQASALHAVQLWETANGNPIIPDADCAIAAYAHATGYDPLTGQHDNGTILLDFLKYWMLTGIPVTDNGALDVLDGFAVIDPRDIAAISKAVDAFGVVYSGAEMPLSADAEFDAGEPWTDLSGNPANGHAIPIVHIDAQGPWVITWGKRQPVIWSWWLKYGSECYAPLRRDWVGKRGLAPSGLTMAQLDAKIASIKGTLGVGAY